MTKLSDDELAEIWRRIALTALTSMSALFSVGALHACSPGSPQMASDGDASLARDSGADAKAKRGGDAFVAPDAQRSLDATADGPMSSDGGLTDAEPMMDAEVEAAIHMAIAVDESLSPGTPRIIYPIYLRATDHSQALAEARRAALDQTDDRHPTLVQRDHGQYPQVRNLCFARRDRDR